MAKFITVTLVAGPKLYLNIDHIVGVHGDGQGTRILLTTETHNVREDYATVTRDIGEMTGEHEFIPKDRL